MLITVELSSEQGFNGILQGNVINESTADGYSWQKANEGNSFGSTEHEGKKKSAFIWDVKPSGNELNSKNTLKNIKRVMRLRSQQN